MFYIIHSFVRRFIILLILLTILKVLYYANLFWNKGWSFDSRVWEYVEPYTAVILTTGTCYPQKIRLCWDLQYMYIFLILKQFFFKLDVSCWVNSSQLFDYTLTKFDKIKKFPFTLKGMFVKSKRGYRIRV